MKFIYWNTRNIDTIERILDILSEEGPDLFFLSEISVAFLEMNQERLGIAGYEYYPNPGCEKVKILRRTDVEIELSLQARYYTTLKLIDSETYVVSVHLPSQMFQHMDALKEFLRDFRGSVDSVIGNSLDKKILLIGDFNVNPFEKPMIDFDGFMATNSPNSRLEITHLGKRKSSYYNLTWQLYSRIHFPGTKHFRRPSGASYDIIEFHYLDQVLVSHFLKEKIITDRIAVIENTSNFSFLSRESNLIEGSDHLPLLYEFNLI